MSPEQDHTKQKALSLVQYALMLFPFIVYMAYVIKYARNIPRQDDYDAILGFLNTFAKAQFPDKLALLLSQHNEHRILFSRLMYAGYYSVAGSINFKGLIFINALLLTLIVLMLIHFSRKLLPGKWQWAAIAISFCLFNVNSYENADFAMAGSQNYGVIFLFLASMFCYSQKKKSLLPLAALLQVLCVFSSGNGNVGAFFLLVYTLLNKDRNSIITCAVFFAIFSPLYYYHYQSPQSGMFTLNPLKFLPFFLHAAGAQALFRFSLIAGFLLMVALLWVMPVDRNCRIKENALPFVCIMGFALCSLAVMAVFRGNQAIVNSYASRYFIYSNVLVCLLLIFALAKFQKHRLAVYVPAALLLFLAVSFKRNCKEGAAGFRYIYNNEMLLPYDHPNATHAKMVTDKACELHIYCRIQ